MLPTVSRGTNYRTEAVDLQPGGSTIAVTVPSDNPFEDGLDIEIVTQDSGGMAGPDPRMRSRGVIARSKKTGGAVRHLNAGFLPGMGDGEEIEVGVAGTVRAAAPKGRPARKPKVYTVSAGFLPGMGADLDDQVDGMGADPVKDTGFKFFEAGPGEPAEKPTDWGAAAEKLSAGIAKGAESAAGLLMKRSDTQAAQAMASSQSAQARSAAKAEAARAAAAQAQAAADAARAEAEARKARAQGMSTVAKVGIGAGALVVLGIAAFLLLRKKK